MGQIKNAKQDKADQRRRARARGRSSEPADWSLVDAGVIQRLICAVTAQGGAVRFGYTSDGGAYSVGLYGDGDPYTEYIRPSEDIAEVLADIAAAWVE